MPPYFVMIPKIPLSVTVLNLTHIKIFSINHQMSIGFQIAPTKFCKVKIQISTIKICQQATVIGATMKDFAKGRENIHLMQT